MGEAQTATRPVPVVLPTPLTIAVYPPGASVASIAGSFESDGAKPVSTISCAFAALPQLSLVAMITLSMERTSVSVGLTSGSAIPKLASEGPATLTTTVLLAVPPMMNPAIITSLPVSTSPRVEILRSREASAGGASPIPTTSNSRTGRDQIPLPVRREKPLRSVVIWGAPAKSSPTIHCTCGRGPEMPQLRGKLGPVRATRSVLAARVTWAPASTREACHEIENRDWSCSDRNLLAKCRVGAGRLRGRSQYVLWIRHGQQQYRLLQHFHGRRRRDRKHHRIQQRLHRPLCRVAQHHRPKQPLSRQFHRQRQHHRKLQRFHRHFGRLQEHHGNVQRLYRGARWGFAFDPA